MSARTADYRPGKPFILVAWLAVGYVVDDVIRSKRGGRTIPRNMQWQTVDKAKAKDRWE